MTFLPTSEILLFVPGIKTSGEIIEPGIHPTVGIHPEGEIGEGAAIWVPVVIGKGCKIGHHVMIGGQVGTLGHIRVGDFVQIGAQSGVAKSVPDKEVIFGYPARPIMRTRRIEAVVNQLPELLKRVRELEKEVVRLKGEG